MNRSLTLTFLAFAFSVSLFAQQDAQQPRPQTKSSQGLLKVNRLYYDLSASTGGDFYFWAAGEFAAVAPIDIPTGGEEVVLAYGTLSGAKTVFEIPVESGARGLTIFCGIQRKDLAVIVRPDGSPARHGDPGVKIQSFQHMTIATVESPAPGSWKLELVGAGLYSISAKLKAGTDAPSLDSFEFVERRGRPGHEGLFPIERTPKRGETLMARGETSGTISKVSFSFVTGDGKPIARCPLTLQEGEWLGSCSVPAQPFRVTVAGVDGAGKPFRRIDSGLVTPE
ncbi:MAG: hypothetical protein WC538_06130 [Thermoanaerobaculia bacterium]|jgi:hypothetical protein